MIALEWYIIILESSARDGGRRAKNANSSMPLGTYINQMTLDVLSTSEQLSAKIISWESAQVPSSFRRTSTYQPSGQLIDSGV